MKNFTIFSVLAFLLSALAFIPQPVLSQQSNDDLGFSGQFFFSFEHDITENEFQNEYTLKRGYITFRRHISEDVQIRFTQDVSIDQEGDGLGDIELRLKYALVQYSMKDLGLFTSPNVEFGVVNRPWVDFEQDVNDYRSQRSMFLDQNNILSSADYGITFTTGLGEELGTYKQRGLKSTPARFGSIGFGLYNGGGYSSLETNNNKLFEGRLTLRPFGAFFPGLQTSFFGAIGKGNISQSPDFQLMASAISYESQKFNMMLQAFISNGDAAGRFVRPVNFRPYELEGWSAFMEFLPFNIPISFTLRAEELTNRNLQRYSSRSGLVGIAYVFNNKSKIILDVSHNQFDNIFNDEDFTRIELVTEIRF